MVIKYKYLFIGFSALLVILAIWAMIQFGFRQGIDFVGGTLWQISFDAENNNAQSVANLLSEASLEGVSVRQGSTPKDFIIRLKEIKVIQKKVFGDIEVLRNKDNIVPVDQSQQDQQPSNPQDINS